jgi:phosphatidylinositol alpha-mannosyltransferase
MSPRRTLVEHMGGDAVEITNGVYVDAFTAATPDPRWTGTPDRPTIAFLGRLDEARKGLPVLLEAVPRVLAAIPGARFLVAGRGETGPDEVRELLGETAAKAVEFLGGISDDDKANLLASVDVYCGPQTGGESFGIVLVEAMSAGATVVASDLGAFSRVLDDGEAGVLFRTGDSEDLAQTLVRVLQDPALRAAVSAHALEVVRQYDWATVTDQVLAVYEMVVADGRSPVGEDPSSVRGARLLELRRGRGEAR